MKKLTTIIAAVLLTTSSFAQEAPKDSLVLQVTMDTTTFKNVIGIIQRQLDSKTASEYILKALSNYQLVADKPKQVPQIKKN